MKKILVLCIVLGPLFGRAAIHNITATNFQFIPSNLNVVVGDVIRWQLGDGFHNTVSLIVPPGAAPWSSPELSTIGNSFSYTVTSPGSYSYECSIHANFMTGSFTASGAVPVTLAAFNVNKRNNRPRISWTTQQESNSDYFAVRRSYDGAIFTEIGRVPAAFHSAVPRTYSFDDGSVKPNAKYIYYELAIVDKDASQQLSPIRLYTNNDQVQKLITAISPNPVPAVGHLLISFNADETGMLRAQVTDLAGKTLLVKGMSAAVGVNSGHIHLGDLPSGTYVIRFTLDGVTETFKVRKK